MGGAMVEAILADGYRVWVYDIDAAAASALEPLGAQEAPGPGALAAQADVILTSLPDARAVRAVCLGGASRHRARGVEHHRSRHDRGARTGGLGAGSGAPRCPRER